ncbi:MAG: TIGR03960 family B12-binding radical SAM protein [Elusimicrobiota bacterium]
MKDKIDKILPFVQHPSRYIGCEYNVDMADDINKFDMRICLAFPDLYEIGISNIGVKLLYHLLDRDKKSLVDMVCAPMKDYSTKLRENNVPLSSLHYRLGLETFDLIGFSLSYELSYVNVLEMLSLSGIAIHSNKRVDNDPIVIAGGGCACNPEPMTDFLDAFVLGDGEGALPIIVKCLRKNKKKTRLEKLKELSKIEGVYVPLFFNPEYDKNNKFIGINKLTEVEFPKHSIVKDLNKSFFPSKIMVPYVDTVHNQYSVEIQRGCWRGCKFCQASYINRPVRYRNKKTILKLIEDGIRDTGYEKVSLLSLSAVDHPEIESIISSIIKKDKNKRLSVSLPSLRCDAFSLSIADLVSKNKKSGLTFAPEAGSQRLRDYIGKDLREEDIFNALDGALNRGWRLVKLYFMYGLPTETWNDIEEMIDLVKRIKQKFRGLNLNIGISSFVPKAHTPFQWAKQEDAGSLIEKKQFILKSLKGIAKVKYSMIEQSVVEGLLARGGRKTAKIIESAWVMGAGFDQWQECFNFEIWQNAAKESGINLNEWVSRDFSFNDKLPWSHLDFGVSASVLKKILETEPVKSQNSAVSICVQERTKYIAPAIKKNNRNVKYAFRVRYAKSDHVRFVSHLELVDMIRRSLIRSGLPLAYSQGFHPLPCVSFAPPLQVGFSGENELFDFWLEKPKSQSQMQSKLRKAFPYGFLIKEVKRIKEGTSALHKTIKFMTFTITCPDSVNWDIEKIAKFNSEERVITYELYPKTRQEVDLKEIIEYININDNALEIKVDVSKRNFNILRLAGIIFNIPFEELKGYDVVRKKIE